MNGRFNPIAATTVSARAGEADYWTPGQAAHAGESCELELDGGPSFQSVKTQFQPETHQLGGEVNASMVYHASKALALRLSPGFSKVATVYNRYYATGAMDYTFQ